MAVSAEGDAAVGRGALADLALSGHRSERVLEQLRQPLEPVPLRAQLEELLLRLRAEVDMRGYLERERARRPVRLVDLCLRHGSELAEHRERLVGGLRVRRRVVRVL